MEKSLRDDGGALSISVWNNTVVRVDTHLHVNHPDLRASRKVAKCERQTLAHDGFQVKGFLFFWILLCCCYVAPGQNGDTQKAADTNDEYCAGGHTEGNIPICLHSVSTFTGRVLCVCPNFSEGWSIC